jgi:hypothetical protein
VDKFKLLVQGLFNFGQNIREERFESVQIIMGKLHAVFSAEDIMSINKAIHDFKEDYENRYKIAKKTYSSTLYNLTKKAMSGCILEMHCLSEAEQKQLELDIEKAKVETLQGSLDVMKQEKEVLQAQRVKDKKAMEAMKLQLKQDKEAMELQLKEDKKVMEAKLQEYDATMKKLSAFMSRIESQQAASSTSESNTDMPESSHVGFFKP